MQQIKIQSGVFYSISAVWDYFFSEIKDNALRWELNIGNILRKGVPFGDVLLWALRFCNL